MLISSSDYVKIGVPFTVLVVSLIDISEPTRLMATSGMPCSA
ncbi:hypothetical protein [Enterobacter intestinihominis]